MVAFFALKRVRITHGKHVAYDEVFHRGVNIIRGENSSGKSTISDFIFYGLGGEFDRWKDAARNCTAVRMEIETDQSTITVQRAVGTKQEPILVYYGDLEESLSKGIDDWQRVSIRRTQGSTELSFTQVLFRAAGIPEAPNVGNSNITMHQVLRLLYADQQTPPGKLFKFETFDTREIRDTVGQLIVGVNGYELYESLLRVRELKAEYQDKDRLYKATVMSLPGTEGLTSIAALNVRMGELSAHRDRVIGEIRNVDNLVAEDRSKHFVAQRQEMQRRLRKLASDLQDREQRVVDLADEQEEIGQFVAYLEEQLAALNAADDLSEKLGNIEFQYCPACLQPLADGDTQHCIVCHEVVDEDKTRSRYFELKVDNELQIRESRQLLTTKAAQTEKSQTEIRALRREYSSAVSDFSSRYDISNSPRESFLAERYKLLGRLEREGGYLEELRATLQRIDELSAERAKLNDQIELLEAKIKRLEASSYARVNKAMNLVDVIGKRILKADLKREDTFEDPSTFSINFADDAMLVDGKMNFAESSNVVLKNTAILSLLLAAAYDADFWHPKFLLMDNIEDKGMEQKRSHNYQHLIIQESAKAKFPHQIIFTTSMLDPKLEASGLTVGSHYTRENKALKNI
ncbi:AAA domain-containing protein [Mesorhizobium loti]|uniref:AAA domain-containing protein n=1 Tax=Rhizobium loti TaxID=381 RepID=A0A8E2WAC8_RHILI|nr:ATP-binding protein [Mesorhizobium loti]PWJ88234.1 AAA domain-containing protein [Mesorhizobium loti]